MAKWHDMVLPVVVRSPECRLPLFCLLDAYKIVGVPQVQPSEDGGLGQKVSDGPNEWQQLTVFNGD